MTKVEGQIPQERLSSLIDLTLTHVIARTASVRVSIISSTAMMVDAVAERITTLGGIVT